MRCVRGPGPYGSRIVAAVATITLPASIAACSVLLDWSSFSDGNRVDGGGHPDATVDVDAGTDAGEDADLHIDAPALVACGVGKLCSPAVPLVPGWSGPYALVLGDPANPPGCDPAVFDSKAAFDGKGGLDAGPTQCTCKCATPQGVTCSAPNVTLFADTSCDSACGPPVPLDQCVPVPLGGPCRTITIGGTFPVGGACGPQPSMVFPAPSWSTQARACQPGSNAGQGSCSSGELCLPSSAPFCIMNQGDIPCPSGGQYPFRHVYFSGSNDDRACSPCACSPPSGAQCSFSSSFPFPVGSWGDPGPAGCNLPTGQPFITPVGCTGTVPSAAALRLIHDAGPNLDNPGSCQVVDGGVPSGSVVPSGPTTLCCTR